MSKHYTLQNLFEKTVTTYSNYPCTGFIGEETLSYGVIAMYVRKISTALQNFGIKEDDRVALISENSPHWGMTYFAINRCGAVAVPILPDFSVAEMQNILMHVEATAIFVSKKLYGKLRSIMEKLKILLFSIDTFEVIDPNSEYNDHTRITKSMLAGIPDEADYQCERKENDIASIIYTSGTTGSSKGVMLTNKNIVWDAEAARNIPEIYPGDVLVSILPLAHTYEFTIGYIVPFSLGATIFYMRRPLSAQVLLSALAKVRPHVMLSVPLIIEKIYRQNILKKFTSKKILKTLYSVAPLRKICNRMAGKKLMEIFGERLKFFGIGGAPLAPDVERFLREAKFPYAIGYGLTETAPLLAGCSPSETKRKSTGPFLKGIEYKILKEECIDHTEKNKNSEGEIVVRGPNVMKGYYKDPEKTAEVLSKDGWFRTGDLGVLDKQGYLFIKGRSKNMFLGPTGENIFPEAIEAIINTNAAVEDSLVFQHQNRIFARVLLKEREITEETNKSEHEKKTEEHGYSKPIVQIVKSLQSEINQRLNRFSKLSAIILQQEPFERTPTKKIKRFLYNYLKKGEG